MNCSPSIEGPAEAREALTLTMAPLRGTLLPWTASGCQLMVDVAVRAAALRGGTEKEYAACARELTDPNLEDAPWLAPKGARLTKACADYRASVAPVPPIIAARLLMERKGAPPPQKEEPAGCC
jgi:hypothetical protein